MTLLHEGVIVVCGAVEVELLVDIAWEWLDATDALEVGETMDDVPLLDFVLEDPRVVELSTVECGIVKFAPWELVAECVDVCGWD